MSHINKNSVVPREKIAWCTRHTWFVDFNLLQLSLQWLSVANNHQVLAWARNSVITLLAWFLRNVYSLGYFSSTRIKIKSSSLNSHILEYWFIIFYLGNTLNCFFLLSRYYFSLGRNKKNLPGDTKYLILFQFKHIWSLLKSVGWLLKEARCYYDW